MVTNTTGAKVNFYPATMHLIVDEVGYKTLHRTYAFLPDATRDSLRWQPTLNLIF